MSIIEARQQLVTVESDYHVKRDIFVRSKDYQQSLLDQCNDLSQKKFQLEKMHRETASAGN